MDKVDFIMDIFLKDAAYSGYAPKSTNEALSLLDISPEADITEELLKQKKREMALKHHPDRGGDLEAMKKMLAAIEYLSESLSNKEDTEFFDDPNPSYEEIASMRDQMGRENFDKKFPGWISEIKQEMGLDDYNKTFEHYDPNYNPEHDLDYQRSQEDLWQHCHDVVYNSIDLDGFEENLSSLTQEEVNWVVNSRSSFEDVSQFLIDHGAKISTDQDIKDYNLENKITAKDLSKLKNEIIDEKIKNIIKFNVDSSLEDILKNGKLFSFFSPQKHLTAENLKFLSESPLVDDFISFIENDRKLKFSHFSPGLSSKHDIINSKIQHKCQILGSLFVEFLKSKGYNVYNNLIFNSVFLALSQEDYLTFKKLVDAANPVNYIKSASIKEARKHSADPAQEKLREAKDKWNSETSELIKKLISFKRGLNGRGDKQANLPPSSIKEPLPVEVGAYWNEVASSAAKVIEHAKAIINEQESYSKNRRKSSESELELIKLADMLAEASWWGSRLYSKFPLFFKLPKDQREVVTNLIYDFVDLSDNLKKFEEQILMPNKSGIGQAFTTANIIINNFSDIIEKNLRKLKLFALESEKESIPDFSDKQKPQPGKKEVEETLKEKQVSQEEVQPEEEKKSRDALHAEALITQKRIMEDISVYKEDILQYISNTELFSASPDLRVKVNEINNNLDRLKRKFDSEKFEKTGPSFIQGVANLENAYKELLFVIKKFVFLKYKGEDLETEAAPKLIKDMGNFSSFEEMYLNLMPQIQLQMMQSKASVKTWIREKILGLSSDSFTRKQVELSKESTNIRKQINNILNRLEKPDSSIKSILMDSLQLKEMLTSWSDEVVQLGETYTLHLRRSEKEKDSYKYDIKREDLTKMLKSKQDL